MTSVSAVQAVAVALLPRQTETAPLLQNRAQCPANTFACSPSLGAVFNDVCCHSGQICALDANNNAACCPSGAVCTGIAPATGAGANPTAASSYVPNPYFPFPYAPASFANSASCVSANKACSKNYDACLLNFGMVGYGVTVNVPGRGGTTINGDVRSYGPSATSICSSLSSQACPNPEGTRCDTFGQGSTAAKVSARPLVVITAGIAAILHLLAVEVLY